MTLLAEIEAFLEATNMPPSVFGKGVCQQPGFVQRIREGRQCGAEVKARVRAYIEENKHLKFIPRISKEESERRSIMRNQHVVGRLDISGLVRVDRTPCYNCGVRGDIGCEHFPREHSKRRSENILDSAFLRINNKTARSSSAKAETGLTSTAYLGGNQ